MRKEVISATQAFIMIAIFVEGSTVVMTNYTIAKQDTWLSFIVAMILAIPLMLLYGSVLNLYPGKDIFQIMEIVLGKVFGKVLSLAMVFYCLFLSSISFRNLIEYIKVVSFPETPIFFTSLMFGILIIYAAMMGIEVLARLNKFLLPFLILLTLLTLLLMFPQAKWTNILPVLYNGWKPVLKAGTYYFSLPFGELVIFLAFVNRANEEKQANKIFLIGLFVSGILLLNVILRNIIVLGFPTLSITTFPSNYALRVLDVHTFIRGLEVVSTIRITISVFLKVTACLIAASIGISRVFDLEDYKPLTIPLSLLAISINFIIVKGILDMIDFTTNYYTLFALPFQVVIPLIVLFVGMFRKTRVNEEN